jgi:C-terminal processing protease CtpA/Prc
VVLAVLGSCTDRRGDAPQSTDSVVNTAPSLPPVTTGSPSDGQLPRSRADYVNEVIDVVEAKAYYAYRVNFTQWRSEVARIDAAAPISFIQSLQLVGKLLAELGDHHSVRLSPGERKSLDSQLSSDNLVGTAPSGGVDAAGIGYLNLPGVRALQGSGRFEQYVDAARQILDQRACGWIADLRGDQGGSVPPMLAAVAPLLGSGTFVGYHNRAGETSGFEISASGEVNLVDSPVFTTTSATFSPQATDSTMPVAVLIGSSTASAGEAVVIAFAGRPITRTFGGPTAGEPTGSSVIDLSDGSALVLTTAIGLDRNGRTYETAIIPDTPATSSGTADDVRVVAESWLASQQACRR